jgi:hypothetical protein
MPRRPAGTLALCLLTWITTAQDVGAFIQVLMPLQSVIDDSDYIFVTKVERIDPDKPSLVLHVQEQLKGQASMKSLPINLTGDKEAAKAKHTEKLLQRVAPEVPIIVCVKKQEAGKFMGLAFTNGTWFQVLGTTDGDQTRWAFTHCEIYLRRTFKGTTEELQQSITESLAGQKKPPLPNPKEPAGLGPEIAR